MGNFAKVSAGSGILKVAGTDLGFLKGQGKIVLNRELLELRTGVPKKFQGALVKEMIHRIEMPVAELDADTLSKCSGFTPVTSVLGVLTQVLDAANQEKTFGGGWGGSDVFEFITLDGPNVENLAVKNVAEAVTYVAGTDYFLLDDLGVVLRIEGGAIASGATVRLIYDYTPVASKRLNIGKDFAIFNLTDVEFTHTRPDGKKVRHFMHKAQASGNVELSYDTEASDFIMTNFMCEALDDVANNPNSPLGYWDFVE